MKVFNFVHQYCTTRLMAWITRLWGHKNIDLGIVDYFTLPESHKANNLLSKFKRDSKFPGEFPPGTMPRIITDVKDVDVVRQAIFMETNQHGNSFERKKTIHTQYSKLRWMLTITTIFLIVFVAILDVPCPRLLHWYRLRLKSGRDCFGPQPRPDSCTPELTVTVRNRNPGQAGF